MHSPRNPKTLRAAVLILAALVVSALPAANVGAESVSAQMSSRKVKLTYKVERILVGKTYKWSDLVTINSKGRQNWRMQTPCKASRAKKTMTANATGNGFCTFAIDVARWKNYRATTIITSI